MPDNEQNMEKTDEEVNEVEELEIKDTTNTSKEDNSSEKTFTQKELQEEVSRVVSREKARLERKHRKEQESNQNKSRQLETVLRAGLGLSNEDDVLSKVTEFYKEQGVNIPETKSNINKKDAEILGKSDAKELIDVADDLEIEARANELAVKQKQGKTSAREDAEFFKLGEYLTSKLDEKELKANGIDTSILKDKEFKDFASKFNRNMKISEIYEMWEKVNGDAPKKPASTGSSKSTTPDNQIKEYYTSEEVDKLSSKDLDNPTILKRVRESMKRW